MQKKRNQATDFLYFLPCLTSLLYPYTATSFGTRPIWASPGTAVTSCALVTARISQTKTHVCVICWVLQQTADSLSSAADAPTFIPAFSWLFNNLKWLSVYDYDDEAVWILSSGLVQLLCNCMQNSKETPLFCGTSVLSDVYSYVFSFSLILKEIPVEACADMGRQEADYVWKKDTDNIQEVFDFMEELGS